MATTDTTTHAHPPATRTPIRRLIIEILTIIVLILGIIIMAAVIVYGVRFQSAVNRFNNTFPGGAASTVGPPAGGPTQGPENDCGVDASGHVITSCAPSGG